MKDWYHVGGYNPGTLGAPYFRPLIPSAGNRPIAATANKKSVRYPFQIHFSINGQKPTGMDLSTWTSMNAFEVQSYVNKMLGSYCVSSDCNSPSFCIPSTCSRPGHLVRVELLRNVASGVQRVRWDEALGDWLVL